MENLAVQEAVIHKSLVGHIVSKMKHSVVELLEVQELHLHQDITLQKCVTGLPIVHGQIMVVNVDFMARLRKQPRKLENMPHIVRQTLISVSLVNQEDLTPVSNVRNLKAIADKVPINVNPQLQEVLEAMVIRLQNVPDTVVLGQEIVVSVLASIHILILPQQVDHVLQVNT